MARRRSALPFGQVVVALCMTCAGLAVIPASAAADDIAAGTNGTRLDQADARRMALYDLIVPVRGVAKRDLRDTYNEQRDGHAHEALDIPARRGAQVVAAGDGRIVKLFTSRAGGLTVYQFDPSERFAYYYAHLDRYEPSLAEGMVLKRGDAIGAVGTTGNTRDDSPYLHFAIFKLGPEKRWWEGSPVNPFPLLN